MDLLDQYYKVLIAYGSLDQYYRVLIAYGYLDQYYRVLIAYKSFGSILQGFNCLHSFWINITGF